MRKGLMYTLYVMAFILSLSIFILLQDNPYEGGFIGEKIRGDEIGFFVRGAEADLERGVLISGRKALLSLSNNEVSTGSFVSSANESIQELMQNGTLGDENQNLMKNSTISSWSRALQNIGNEKKFDVNISTSDVRVRHASAFEVAAAGNTTTIVYDPLTRIKYNRTFLLYETTPLEGLEDPYITIRSFGSVRNTIEKCTLVRGVSSGSQWTYGKAYVSKAPDFSGVESKNDKILITDTLGGKTGYSGFNATVTEDNSAFGQNALSDASGAYESVKNNSYVVLSNDVLWLSNFTSCYFESPLGPSFLDRLEGRGTLSQKYNVSGAIAGLGSIVYVPSVGYVLDYAYYT